MGRFQDILFLMVVIGLNVFRLASSAQSSCFSLPSIKIMDGFVPPSPLLVNLEIETDTVSLLQLYLILRITCSKIKNEAHFDLLPQRVIVAGAKQASLITVRGRLSTG